jgi:hypothetical protein
MDEDTEEAKQQTPSPAFDIAAEWHEADGSLSFLTLSRVLVDGALQDQDFVWHFVK